MTSRIKILSNKDLPSWVRYSIEVLIYDFLGMNWSLEVCPNDRNTGLIALEVVGSEHTLYLPEVALSVGEGSFALEPPSGRLPMWRPADNGLNGNFIRPEVPVLFGSPGVETCADGLRLHLDILSSAFFMLSDFDAFHSENRDCHGRFSARSSRAYADGFLDRPLLDEYVEILWLCMKRLWPSLVRKQPRGKILVSCDVDRPFLPAAASVMDTVKSLGADVLRRRSPGTAVRRLLASMVRGRFGDRVDPYNTFDWYMSVCEQYGRRAAFYFLVAGTSDLDGDYSLEDDRIEALIRSASSRGHEVGIHGSYNSILDEKQIVCEKRLLENCLTKLGIDSVVAGNRQHYLRWNSKTTAGFLDDAGYIYDTTGGYADHTGFRFGTAREFPMWCWHKQERLHIIQRPLIVMDVTLLSQEYMALGYGNAVNEHVAALKDRALRYGGNFTVLWHNSNLLTRRDRELFEYCIQDEKQITP